MSFRLIGNLETLLGKYGDEYMFDDIFKGKKVLVTGNTGFKGSWLSQWLLQLEANVIGISKDIPTKPSLFELLDLESKISHFFCNLNDSSKLEEIIFDVKPDFIFHLAAQPIVSESFRNPIETISSNTLGTANLLNVISKVNWKCSAVIITSDKCYENVEKEKGYKETDLLGGKDIYSSSKAAAEILISSFFRTFLKNKNKITLAIGRAGNVIGGGDWAKDRLVVDSINSWKVQKPVYLRNPLSTRPWQHVLEPLSGYLHLAKIIYEKRDFNGEAFNFGPKNNDVRTVEDIILGMSKYFDLKIPYKIINEKSFPEAGFLQLDISKANNLLNWSPVLSFDEMINFVSEWYFSFLENKKDISQLTLNQIKTYENLAKNKKLSWANP